MIPIVDSRLEPVRMDFEARVGRYFLAYLNAVSICVTFYSIICAGVDNVVAWNHSAFLEWLRECQVDEEDDWGIRGLLEAHGAHSLCQASSHAKGKSNHSAGECCSAMRKGTCCYSQWAGK